MIKTLIQLMFASAALIAALSLAWLTLCLTTAPAPGYIRRGVWLHHSGQVTTERFHGAL